MGTCMSTNNVDAPTSSALFMLSMTDKHSRVQPAKSETSTDGNIFFKNKNDDDASNFIKIKNIIKKKVIDEFIVHKDRINVDKFNIVFKKTDFNISDIEENLQYFIPYKLHTGNITYELVPSIETDTITYILKLYCINEPYNNLAPKYITLALFYKYLGITDTIKHCIYFESDILLFGEKVKNVKFVFCDCKFNTIKHNCYTRKCYCINTTDVEYEYSGRILASSRNRCIRNTNVNINGHYITHDDFVDIVALFCNREISHADKSPGNIFGSYYKTIHPEVIKFIISNYLEIGHKPTYDYYYLGDNLYGMEPDDVKFLDTSSILRINHIYYSQEHYKVYHDKLKAYFLEALFSGKDTNLKITISNKNEEIIKKLCEHMQVLGSIFREVHKNKDGFTFIFDLKYKAELLETVSRSNSITSTLSTNSVDYLLDRD